MPTAGPAPPSNAKADSARSNEKADSARSSTKPDSCARRAMRGGCSVRAGGCSVRAGRMQCPCGPNAVVRGECSPSLLPHVRCNYLLRPPPTTAGSATASRVVGRVEVPDEGGVGGGLPVPLRVA
jgi:hypothetical protein